MRTRTTHRSATTLPALTGLLAAALLATGCGGGGTAPGSTPADPTGSARPGPTEASVQPTTPGDESDTDAPATLLPGDDATLLPGDGAVGSTPPLVGELVAADLQVEVVEGGSGAVALTCSFAQGVVSGEGDHPDVQAACTDLQAALAAGDPFAPVPPDAMCTQQFGGEAVVAVRGTLTGVDGSEVPVDTTFRLNNGCEIDRWERMGQVLAPFRGQV
ncbi:hypothetical protein [Aquipuribacter sp. SD81]|uniref:hypothetical protein n=1 Tax=Aquipuribacter sp. SD81 TaxID=3127703 RepID=UPI0030161D8C